MKKTSYWLGLALGVLGPLFYIGTFYFRFGRLGSQQLNESLVTALPVALGGLLLVWLLNRAPDARTHRTTWLGFLVALPFGLFGSIIGGMLGVVGNILYGLLPLAMGAGVGYLTGKMLK